MDPDSCLIPQLFRNCLQCCVNNLYSFNMPVVRNVHPAVLHPQLRPSMQETHGQFTSRKPPQTRCEAFRQHKLPVASDPLEGVSGVRLVSRWLGSEHR